MHDMKKQLEAARQTITQLRKELREKGEGDGKEKVRVQGELRALQEELQRVQADLQRSQLREADAAQRHQEQVTQMKTQHDAELQRLRQQLEDQNSRTEQVSTRNGISSIIVRHVEIKWCLRWLRR